MKPAIVISLTAIQSKLNATVSESNFKSIFYEHGSCSNQDIANGFFNENNCFDIYRERKRDRERDIEAKIGQQPTTDKQDFIYTLGFELLSLCNEAWHMLHAA
jgi:hypothetical protein